MRLTYTVGEVMKDKYKEIIFIQEKRTPYDRCPFFFLLLDHT